MIFIEGFFYESFKSKSGSEVSEEVESSIGR